MGAVAAYYASIGHPTPLHVNPAEFLLEQVNADFAPDRRHAHVQLGAMQDAWAASAAAKQVAATVSLLAEKSPEPGQQQQGDQIDGEEEEKGRKPGFVSLVLTLLHRSFIKSYRDVIAYGVRMAMYFGLAVMMGTVWVRLETEQEYIQPYVNAIVSVSLLY